MIITNHQAVAGQHLNNIVIYTPYFREGELLMFAIVRAHWIDVGGMSTGFGAGPHVADPWLEGLQLDQLKIYERASSTRRSIASSATTSASPNPRSATCGRRSPPAGSPRAGSTSCSHKYGRDTILAAIQQIFDETEQKCRNVVAAIPDGVYEAESALDDDGVLRDDPVRLHAKVTVASGRHDDRPLAVLARAQGRDQLAHLCGARASPTRR